LITSKIEPQPVVLNVSVCFNQIIQCKQGMNMLINLIRHRNWRLYHTFCVLHNYRRPFHNGTQWSSLYSVLVRTIYTEFANKNWQLWAVLPASPGPIDCITGPVLCLVLWWIVFILKCPAIVTYTLTSCLLEYPCFSWWWSNYCFGWNTVQNFQEHSLYVTTAISMNRAQQQSLW